MTDDEAKARKQRSIQILKDHQVPYIDHLPVIETANEIDPPSIEDVARRAACCFFTIQAACDIAAGEDDSRDFFMGLIRAWGVQEELSPYEKVIFSGEATEKEAQAMTWRYEAVWTLLWALGFTDDLDYPQNLCDCEQVIDFFKAAGGLDGFLAAANPRVIEEILDEADLIFRYHWAVVDARLNEQKTPADLSEDVVLERHMALNWLIGIDDDWDNTSVNT